MSTAATQRPADASLIALGTPRSEAFDEPEASPKSARAELGGGATTVIGSEDTSFASTRVPARGTTPQEGQVSARERLAMLWQARTAPGQTGDFALGPGDVIEINVPAMPELRDRTIRVSGDRNLSLPLVGNLDVTGMMERDLKDALRHRLETYMYNPQVDLFVKEYRSRQVAVMGAVEKPGLYSLASSSDTVMSMLSQAGGLSREAAERVLFVPGDSATTSGVPAAAAPLPSGTMAASVQPSVSDGLVPGVELQLMVYRSNPIVIDLHNLSRGGTQGYLNLPARPGDVLVVPIAGEVMVEGWVHKPGNYKITPGLTLLGVIGAAGGALFAADLNTVQIARTASDGEKVFIKADVNRIKRKQELDIPVEEGDVVDVSYSAAKLPAYALFNVINRFGAGATVPLF